MTRDNYKRDKVWEHWAFNCKEASGWTKHALPATLVEALTARGYSAWLSPSLEVHRMYLRSGNVFLYAEPACRAGKEGIYVSYVAYNKSGNAFRMTSLSSGWYPAEEVPIISERNERLLKRFCRKSKAK